MASRLQRADIGAWVFERARPTSGVWLIGHTTGQMTDGHGDDYWRDRDEQMRLSPYAGLRMAPLDVPLRRDLVASDPLTSQNEILRQAEMSNPSYLTPKQR